MKDEGEIMSNWTHVAGIVRINHLVLNPDDKIDFEMIFGREVLWDMDWSDIECDPRPTLPMGSEGSLRMSVWQNPDPNSLAAYTISIFGDLRDHDDPNEIINWFKEKLKSFFVRQATITVQNEYNGTVNWTYDHTE